MFEILEILGPKHKNRAFEDVPIAIFKAKNQALSVARSFGSHFVVTANTTDAGVPVYLRADATWSESISDAHPVQTEAERDDLLAEVGRQERRICDPYAFKVNVEGGTAVATTTRERIRSQGPTTPLRRPDAQQG